MKSKNKGEILPTRFDLCFEKFGRESLILGRSCHIGQRCFPIQTPNNLPLIEFFLCISEYFLNVLPYENLFFSDTTLIVLF